MSEVIKEILVCTEGIYTHKSVVDKLRSSLDSANERIDKLQSENESLKEEIKNSNKFAHDQENKLSEKDAEIELLKDKLCYWKAVCCARIHNPTYQFLIDEEPK